MKVRKFVGGLCAVVGLVLFSGCAFLEPLIPIYFPDLELPEKPCGLIQLIEFHDIQGVRNWAYELDERNLKGLMFIQSNILTAYPEDIQWLAAQGHEIAGGYAGEPFWDLPYETQYSRMKETADLIQSILGKKMRVFGSTYFAYDENTIKAAEALGVEFILGRGTADVEALIYKPDEYNVQIISVSNVTFADMGRGSLCDYSLYARGATGEEFGVILNDSVAKNPERIMIVSHAYLGGMKKTWWQAYENVLDSGKIRWAANFDDWVRDENGVNIPVPFNQIPVNREVKYTTPTPSEALENLEDVDEMYNPCAL